MAAFLLGAVAAALLVWEIGWPVDGESRERIAGISILLATAVIALEVFRLCRTREARGRGWRAYVPAAIPVLALIQIALAEWFFGPEGGGLALRGGGLLMLIVSQLALVLSALLRSLRLLGGSWFRKTSPGTLVLGSFALAIMLGTLLLKTPEATEEGISWIDSLFTSTSAVCVTGLIVRDTAVDFTFTGQAIILGLIQAGGLGIMTLAYFTALMTGQGVSLRDRAFLNEMFSQDNVARVGRFVRRVVLVTLVVEAAGALLIHRSWAGMEDGVWQSVFHSVSAFCNAGFSTFSDGLMDPAAIEARGVQTVVMVLIVTGGLGFVVAGQVPGMLFASLRRRVREWSGRRGRRARAPVHVRLVLVTTAVLLAGGAGGFLLLGEDGWTAVFNSVTARTAGFNISDMGALSGAGVMLMCFLMIIGGSPGGTAGGLKTTTVALGVMELRRIVRGRRDVNLWGRRVSREVLNRCHATLVLSFLWIAGSTLLVSAFEPHLALDDVLFECVSAFATVGLSRGITGELGTASKVVIILSMLVGRIGVLSFAMTLGGTPRPRHFTYPEARLPLN